MDKKRKKSSVLSCFEKAYTVCIKMYIVQIAKKYRHLVHLKSVSMIHLNILTHENTASSSSATLSPYASQISSQNSTIG